MNSSKTNSGIFAMVVTLGCMVLIACHKKESQTAFWELERQKIELEQQLKLLTFRAETANPSSFSEFEQLQGSHRKQEQQLLSLRKQLAVLDIENQGLEQRIVDLKKTVMLRQRNLATGKTFAALQTKNGKSFQNVSVKKVDDSGVTIQHESGVATLRFAELSMEQREFFGMDEKLSLTAESRESQARMEYETQLALETKSTPKMTKELPDRLESNSLASDYSPQDYTDFSNTKVRALAQPAKTFGSGYGYRRSYRNSTNGYYGSSYRYVYYYTSPQSSYSTPSSYQCVGDSSYGAVRQVPMKPIPDVTTPLPPQP